MTTVRDSLFVHGNIPCPSPTYSLPPGRTGEPHAARPVKYNPTKAPPMNTEEELRNIQRQAKQPVVNGPTQVAKRTEYFRKIKHLNDGMYGAASLLLDDEPPPPHVEDFVLEGRKVDESKVEAKEAPAAAAADGAASLEFLDMDGQETMHSVGMPARLLRQSPHTKSAKSFYSVSSDPHPVRAPRSITLPQLTIGSSRPHKPVRADVSNQKQEPLSIVVKNALNASKENMNDSDSEGGFAIAEYRFPSTSPRRIYKAGERSPRGGVDSNYGNITLRELKECLQIQQPKTLRSEHEEYVIQDYLTQFKQAQEQARQLSKTKRGSSSVNPYKLLKNPRKSQPSSVKHKPSPRYEFKTVDSYLKFNASQQHSNVARAATVADGQSAMVNGGFSSAAHSHSAQAYSDTLMLKMMSDLNKPAEHARQSASMTAVRLSSVGDGSGGGSGVIAATDGSAKSLRHVVPCNSPVNHTRRPGNKPFSATAAAAAQRDKEREIIQHIVYVPSGQTAKVRLIKA